jgi:hypothetical protein
MTFRHISQRGKQYLKTADTLLRAAQTMTDQAIAGQLKALLTTTSGELRRPRMLMRPKRSLDRLLTLKASGANDLLGNITAQPAEEMSGERWDARCAARSRAFFITSLLPAELQSWADILNRDEMLADILWPTWFLAANSFSNQCLERIWAKLFDLSQSLSAS